MGCRVWRRLAKKKPTRDHSARSCRKSELRGGGVFSPWDWVQPWCSSHCQTPQLTTEGIHQSSQRRKQKCCPLALLLLGWPVSTTSSHGNQPPSSPEAQASDSLCNDCRQACSNIKRKKGPVAPVTGIFLGKSRLQEMERLSFLPSKG